MVRGELEQLKHIAKIVLRAQQVTQPLAIRPRFQCAPVEQAVQHLSRAVERHAKVIPFRSRQHCEILMAGLVLLEADLACFLNAASHSQIGSVKQLDLKVKNKLLKEVQVPKQEEIGITVGEETEVEHVPQRGLTQVVRVLVSVLGKTDLGQDDVQARHEIHGCEQFRLVGIESR